MGGDSGDDLAVGGAEGENIVDGNVDVGGAGGGEEGVDGGPGDIEVVIGVGVELGDGLIGVEIVAGLDDGFRVDCDRELALLFGVGVEVDAGMEEEISGVGRGGDGGEGEIGGGAQVGGGVEDEVLDGAVKFGAGMGSACDGLTSSDVGEGGGVDLEDDSGGVGSSQSVVAQCDIGNFVDDGVGQDDGGCFGGVGVGTSAGVGASVDGLGVDVDDGGSVSGGVFKNGEFEVAVVATGAISLHFGDLEGDE